MSGKPEIRKMYTLVEETHADGVKRLEKPVRKAAAAAVFKNPFADKYVEDLSLLFDWSAELGEILTKSSNRPGIKAEEVQSYGKAALSAKEESLEHCAAILHPAGQALRDNVGGGKAIIPSAKNWAFQERSMSPFTF